MAAYIGLLRGINVGGRNKIAMADLREMCEAIGLKSARTFIQSGNLIFESNRRAGASVESRLESETKSRFGLDVDFVIRSAPEWRAAIEANPFLKEAAAAPSRFVVMFLKGEAATDGVRAIQAAFKGSEKIAAVGRHLYLFYPEGIATSKLTNVYIEKKLNTRGTSRNWNTVLKLAEMVGA